MFAAPLTTPFDPVLDFASCTEALLRQADERGAAQGQTKPRRALSRLGNRLYGACVRVAARARRATPRMSEGHMSDSPSVLFVCEAYYLRFYAPLADRLHRSGFRPIWITLDGPSAWPYEMLDLSPAIDDLAATQNAVGSPELLDRLTLFERIVFDRPDTFKHNYSYTLKNVRTAERARLLADVWYQCDARPPRSVQAVRSVLLEWTLPAV